MPIPALNIIATQETVRNSGASPSRPSGIRPYRLAASHSTYSTKAEARTTNSQPRLVSIQVSALPLVLPRLVGARRPQATNARATTAATPKTTVSSRPVPSAGAVGGSASAGCRLGSGLSRLAIDSRRAWPGGGEDELDTGGCGTRSGASPFGSTCRATAADPGSGERTGLLTVHAATAQRNPSGSRTCLGHRPCLPRRATR